MYVLLILGRTNGQRKQYGGRFNSQQRNFYGNEYSEGFTPVEMDPQMKEYYCYMAVQQM